MFNDDNEDGFFKGTHPTKKNAGKFDEDLSRIMMAALEKGLGARLIASILITTATQILFASTNSVVSVFQIIFFSVLMEIDKRVPSSLNNGSWFKKTENEEEEESEFLNSLHAGKTKH